MADMHNQYSLSRTELLVLGRLTADKGATSAEIVNAMSKIGTPLAESALPDCVAAALASLGARALVATPSRPPAKTGKATKPRAPRFTLTDGGRSALRAALGAKTTPTWKDLVGRIVPALALDEQPDSEAAQRALASSQAMLAGMLRRDRALGTLATVVELCDRIVARALGMPPGPVTADGIRAYALAMHCGAVDKHELEAIAATFKETQAPRTALTTLAVKLAGVQPAVDGASKATIVKSLQRRWLSRQEAADAAQRPSGLRAVPLHLPPPPAESAGGRTSGPSIPRPSANPEPTEALLSVLREAIPKVGSNGRYGKDNVFVSALWRQISRDRRLSTLSLDGFKRWLVTANRNQLVALARADLVDAMDPKLVADSEIEDLGATFHFVLDRREPSSAPGQVLYGR